MDHFDEFGPTFCVLPWLHMMTKPQGTLQLCCVNSAEILQEDGASFHLSESGPDEVWNSASYRDTRKKMLSGERIPSCGSCYDAEAVGGISYRQYSNAWWANGHKEEVSEIVARSRTQRFGVASRPKSLDLRLGNLCNLSCRSCEPFSSSRLAGEWTEIIGKAPEFSEFWDGQPHVPAGQKRRPAAEWHRDKKFLSYVENALSEVKLLYMTGGEPVMVKGNYDLIKTCVARGYAAEMELMLNTNMTVKSPEFFGSFRSFKRVQLNCSIDGFGPVNEYLRFPARWKDVSANLDSFLDVPGTVRTAVYVVAQFHNVLDITDLLRDVDRRRAAVAPRPLYFHLFILRDPSFLSMTVLPKKIRRLAAERLRDFSRSSPLYREDPHSRKCVDAVIETLSAEDRGDARELLDKNLRFTAILDKARGMKMKDYLPELHQRLTAEGVGVERP